MISCLAVFIEDINKLHIYVGLLGPKVLQTLRRILKEKMPGGKILGVTEIPGIMIFVSMGILGLNAISRQKTKKIDSPEWSDIMGAYFQENKLEMKASEASGRGKYGLYTNIPL